MSRGRASGPGRFWKRGCQWVLTWTDETAWAVEGQEGHSAEYTLVAPNLLRSYDCPAGVITDVSCPDGTIIIVARHVADIEFSRSGTFITVKITSTYDGDSQALSYFVTPRSEGAFQ